MATTSQSSARERSLQEDIDGNSTVHRAGPSQAQWATISLAASGACFLLYPAIRPFSDETSLSGAAAFASSAWFLAHSLAMAGFVLLALGSLGVYLYLRDTAGSTPAILSLVLSWIGIGLTLPYYGAETFGLQAVGRDALRQQNAAAMPLANSIRLEEGIWFIMLGLLCLGVGTTLLAVALWRSHRFPGWSGIPLAVGFALFIPQFLTPQPVRIAHGLLIAFGCLLIARGILRPLTPLRR